VGLKKAIVVDLTIPWIGVPVVRAIVPGMETFKFTKSVVGQRARDYIKI
jgi:ribosomal protein S12 methylthiotransferase accessory factor